MQPLGLAYPLSSSSGIASCTVLESRSFYRPCHIQVPDLDKRLAAILVGRRYYSFFKVVTEGRQALEIITKLGAKGDETAITKTAKGYGIWIWESEASMANPLPTPKQVETLAAQLATCKVIESRGYGQSCNIQVPDLDQPLVAVLFEQRYYSLFRALEDANQVLDIAAKLNCRGDAAMITPSEQGYEVWVEEPEAVVV